MRPSHTVSSMPRPHPSRPALPVEAWLKILRHATTIPYLIEATAPDAFSRSLATRLDVIQNRILRSMRIKLAILFVCKTWYNLAIPFTYEAIVIRCPMMLSKLAKAWMPSFLIDGQDEIEGTGKFLQWTRRLHVILKSKPGCDSEIANNLGHLLHKTSRLEILVMRFSNRQAPFLLELPPHPCPLAALSTVSLRYLDIQSDSSLACDESMLHNVLGKQPLVILRIGLGLQGELNEAVTSPITTIKYIHVPDRLLSLLVHLNPDNLSHLSISDFSSTRGSSLATFLSNHGSGLSSLEIPNGIIWARGPDPPSTMTFLHEVAALCPNLTDLILTFRGAAEIPHLTHLDFLPPVKNLGIRMADDTDIPSAIWSSLVSDLPRVMELTPTIHVVRILTRPSFVQQSRFGLSASMLQFSETVPNMSRLLYNKLSVRVEDHIGRLLHSVQ